MPDEADLNELVNARVTYFDGRHDNFSSPPAQRRVFDLHLHLTRCSVAMVEWPAQRNPTKIGARHPEAVDWIGCRNAFATALTHAQAGR